MSKCSEDVPENTENLRAITAMISSQMEAENEVDLNINIKVKIRNYN